MLPIHLQHATFVGQEQAVNELVLLALQVARHQRGEDFLQPHETIKGKFLREIAEFEEAIASKERLAILSELADLVYYSVQDYAVAGDERDLHATVKHCSSRAGVTIEQAYQAALAKYRLRASAPNSKNFEQENAAIEAALQ